MNMPSPENNISRTVGHPPIQRPVGRGIVPELGAPKRKGPSRLVQAVEVIGTGAAILTGAGLVVDKLATGNFPWENPSQGGTVTPGKTPNPGETILMPSATPGQTLEVTIPPAVSPSPSPEVSPSPVPTPTPEATPVPNIENVKLAAEGLVTRETKDYLNVYDGTVVAIERNPDGTVKQFALTV
ncbi:hypothetical protein M1146_06875, partial [Patescibacteria group bacterium]|nr:hypothetical protein [Patescibacteria group bacterium]